MIVTIHGRVGRTDDPMYRDGDDAIKVQVDEANLTAKLVRWTGMGRIITRVTAEGEEVTDTGQHRVPLDHPVPSDEQRESIRTLRSCGVFTVEIERFCPNGDIIVSRSRGYRETYNRIEQDGTIIEDDRIR